MFKVTHLSNMDEKALHSHTAEEKYKKRFIGVLLFGIFSVVFSGVLLLHGGTHSELWWY